MWEFIQVVLWILVGSCGGVFVCALFASSKVLELEDEVKYEKQLKNDWAARANNLETELAECKEWYESLMEHCVDGYYKCAKCGGPVAESLCCAWCETTTPEDK